MKLALLIFLLFTILPGQAQELWSPSDSFPANRVLREYAPTYFKGTHVFYPDSTYLFVRGDLEKSRKEIEWGYWFREGDSIVTEITKTVGLRPIGDPLNPEAMHSSHPEQHLRYPNYTRFESWELRIIRHHPGELQTGLTKIDSTQKAEDFQIDFHRYELPGKHKVASTRLLLEADLKNLHKRDLRIMRNEILARYGYIFNAPDLRFYFYEKSWYKRRSTNVDLYLTDIEKQNMELIRIHESGG